MDTDPNPPRTSPAAVPVRFAIGFVLLLVAVGIFAALRATRPTPPLAAVNQAARQVRVLTVQPVEVARTWIGYGAARAMRSADIAAEVQGVIVERPESIEAGAPIRTGELIAVIDPADYTQRLAQLDSAVAALRAELDGLYAEAESLDRLISLAAESTGLTQKEIDRWRSAMAGGAGAPVELERLERELARAQREEQALRERRSLIPSRRSGLESRISAEEANLTIARRNLERTRIVSPLDGSLQSISVERGELVAPGAPIARVVDLSRIEVPLRLPVSAAAEIRPGDRAVIRAEGPVDSEWTGAVVRIAPEADASTRTITVFVEVRQDPNSEISTRLLPGAFVSGRVAAETPREHIVVPRTAIERGRVLVVDDAGVITAAPVSVLHFVEETFPDLDAVETQWAVLDNGLAPGQRIALTNLDELQPGITVAPVETSAGPRVEGAAPVSGGKGSAQ